MGDGVGFGVRVFFFFASFLVSVVAFGGTDEKGKEGRLGRQLLVSLMMAFLGRRVGCLASLYLAKQHQFFTLSFFFSLSYGIRSTCACLALAQVDHKLFILHRNPFFLYTPVDIQQCFFALLSLPQ